MYRSIGEEPLIFLPGAITPRKQPFQVHETGTRPPPVLKAPPVVHETTPTKPLVPVLLPEQPPADMPEEKSMLPYLIVGGLVLLGGAVFLLRK